MLFKLSARSTLLSRTDVFCYFTDLPVAQEPGFLHSHFFHSFFSFYLSTLLDCDPKMQVSFQSKNFQLFVFSIPGHNLYCKSEITVTWTLEFISLDQFFMFSNLIPASCISQSQQRLQTPHQHQIWPSASLFPELQIFWAGRAYYCFFILCMLLMFSKTPSGKSSFVSLRLYNLFLYHVLYIIKDLWQ